MAHPATLYHNPKCSKSREAKRLLDKAGVDYKTVLYLEDPPGVHELGRLIRMLGGDPTDLVREKEAKAAGWDGDVAPDALIRFLAEHPEAMQRPIVVKEGKAVIARPPERAAELIQS